MISETEFKIFRIVLEKKGYAFFDSRHLRSPRRLTRLALQTTSKRLEERLKVIFKLSIKYLRGICSVLYPEYNDPRHEKTIRRLRISPKDKFFWFFFYEFCQKNDLNFRKLFNGKAQIKQKSRPRAPTRLHADFFSVPISVQFLEYIKGNAKFFAPLASYLLFGRNELDGVSGAAEGEMSILSDFAHSIERKIRSKIKGWEDLFRDCASEAEFFAALERIFSKNSLKLPWSLVDMCCSLRLFKEVICSN